MIPGIVAGGTARGTTDSGGQTSFDPGSVAHDWWYDPSDITTLFKDTAGTDPVTADGDQVRSIKDKSGHSRHATQINLSEAPVYHTSGGVSWLTLVGTPTAGISDYLSASFAGVSEDWDCITGLRLESRAGRVIRQQESLSIYIYDKTTTIGMYGGGAVGDGPEIAVATGADVVISEQWRNVAPYKIAKDDGAAVTSPSIAQQGGNGSFEIEAGNDQTIRWFGSMGKRGGGYSDADRANLILWMGARQGRNLLAPVNTVAPAITGAHDASTDLVCSTGTYGSAHPPTSYAYQWYKDNVVVPFATTNTYVPDSGDLGHTFKCRVTASNADGSIATDSNDHALSEGHSYWRVKTTTVNGGGAYVAWSEVEFRTSVGGAADNSGTSIEDSHYAPEGLIADNAFDGDINTKWACNGTGTACYIGRHFAAPINVAQVALRVRNDGSFGQYATAFDVQYSDDGSAWTTSWSESGVSFGSAGQQQTFEP